MRRVVTLALAANLLFFSLTSPCEKVYALDLAEEMPSDEYERAIWYGFISPELSEDRDKNVTWKEYCTIIGSMLQVKDENLGEQWQDVASLALESDQEMMRDQGCFALYRAAELMGEELNDGGLRAVSTDPHLLPSNDGTLPYSWDYVAFTGEDDSWVFDENYEGLFGSMNYITAAIMFCQYRMSLCSFEVLYDTRTDIIGPLTAEEAAVSVLRLYESVPETAEDFWLARMEMVKEEAAAVGEPEKVTSLRQQILDSGSAIVKSDTLIPGETYTGTAYYVSNSGDDGNDGLTPETPWKTVDKVNHTPFSYGDAVFFERGGIYRGNVYLYNEDGYVTVSAYGEGEKPVLTSAQECAAGADHWELWQEKDGAKIWKYYKDVLDCGLIVFDDAAAGNKVLAEWSGTEWINEDGTSFDITASLEKNLDFFSDDAGKFGGATDFYIGGGNAEEDVQYGPLYLRCDEGNPGELYSCIELCTMTVTEQMGNSYEGTVLNGLYGTVYDNLSIKYFPMAGISVAPEMDCVVQNCEVAWGGGCVQYVEEGKVTGIMGDAINGCGRENSALKENYIHDVLSSAMIMESYGEVQLKNISVSGNLIERTGNGFNINDNEITSMENVNFNDNVFYLTGVSAGGEQDIRSGMMYSGNWSACFSIRELNEYNNCTISGNAMYYPLQFFYYCVVPLPKMSENLYVSTEHTYGFADIRYDEEVGPFLPSLMEEAEEIMQNTFYDSTSIVQ